jgi:hypothetical protein
VCSYQQERWAGDKALSVLHAVLLQLTADNVMNDFDEIFKPQGVLMPFPQQIDHHNCTGKASSPSSASAKHLITIHL